MTELEAIYERHAVRQYIDKQIPNDVIEKLQNEVHVCNSLSGLNIQVVTNDDKAFNSFKAHYGNFARVKNYIALVGDKKDEYLDEKCGYYGQRIVLFLQMLGLNSCWVYLTYSKTEKIIIERGDKLVIVIPFGYGLTQGKIRKSKTFEDVVVGNKKEYPNWFMNGINAALAAPTALNQQKFVFELVDDNKVKVKTKTVVCPKIDLGIIKYNFEAAAGKNNFDFI